MSERVESVRITVEVTTETRKGKETGEFDTVEAAHEFFRAALGRTGLAAYQAEQKAYRERRAREAVEIIEKYSPGTPAAETS